MKEKEKTIKVASEKEKSKKVKAITQKLEEKIKDRPLGFLRKSLYSGECLSQL